MTTTSNDQPRERVDNNRTPISPDELTANLGQFTGTEKYYRYWPKVLLTDGVKYLADTAKCFWLLDIVSSHQGELQKNPDTRLREMQFWTLTLNADKSAVVTCVPDGGEPPAVTQRIEWTDFPLPRVDIWAAPYDGHWVLYLPSEH